MVLPLRSTRAAPAGTGVEAGPTAVIFAPLMTTVPLSMTRPVPSMTRPPTNAVVWAAAVAVLAAKNTNARQPLRMRMPRRLAECCDTIWG